jgi:hypothetical protein
MLNKLKVKDDAPKAPEPVATDKPAVASEPSASVVSNPF